MYHNIMYNNTIAPKKEKSQKGSNFERFSTLFQKIRVEREIELVKLQEKTLKTYFIIDHLTQK